MTTLQEITTKVTDGSHNPPKKRDSGVRMYSAQNVFNNYLDTGSFRLIDQKDFVIENKRTNVEAGDILLTIVGTIGRSYVVKESDGTFALQRSVALIKPDRQKIDPAYLCYYMQSELASLYLNSNARGVAQKGIYLGLLNKMPVPVPKLIDQLATVSKIEELFSDIDRAQSDLIESEMLLQKLHLTVLNSETRGENRKEFNIMGFDKLLVNGRKSLKTGPFGTLIGKKDYVESGVPIIGIENIGELKFVNQGFKKFVSEEKYEELKTYAVNEGDVLISRSGTVGEICVVPANISGIISTNLIRVRLDTERVIPEYYIALFKGSSYVLDQVKELCKGSTRVFLNQGIMKQIRYPIPSLEKQKELLTRIDQLLSEEEQLEAALKVAQVQTKLLKKSVLSKAFKGELL